MSWYERRPDCEWHMRADPQVPEAIPDPRKRKPVIFVLQLPSFAHYSMWPIFLFYDSWARVVFSDRPVLIVLLILLVLLQSACLCSRVMAISLACVSIVLPSAPTARISICLQLPPGALQTCKQANIHSLSYHQACRLLFTKSYRHNKPGNRWPMPCGRY